MIYRRGDKLAAGQVDQASRQVIRAGQLVLLICAPTRGRAPAALAVAYRLVALDK